MNVYICGTKTNGYINKQNNTLHCGGWSSLHTYRCSNCLSSLMLPFRRTKHHPTFRAMKDLLMPENIFWK